MGKGNIKLSLKRLVCKILKHKYPEAKTLREALGEQKCLRCGYVEPQIGLIVPQDIQIEMVEGAKNKPVFITEGKHIEVKPTPIMGGVTYEPKPNVCLKHHFTSFGRCSFCQMQARYYYEALATLNSWPAKKKETQEWKDKVKSIKECKPHVHEDL